MVRNVILLVSTLAVLLLLFAGYSSLVGGSGRSDEAPANTRVTLPPTTQVADERRLRFAGVDVDPGEPMAYIAYHPVTGQPTESFRCDNWEKVPGTRNVVAVTTPELMMRLPSGMVVTVTAEHGQVSGERTDRKGIQPKSGWLAGGARIVIDRATSFDRIPLSERPADQITIEMERLDFDLELGELKTADSLRVTSPEFVVTGTGLHLIWNQADNRVEKLLIESGGQMVLEGALLASLDESLAEPGRGGAPPAANRPAAHATPAPAGKTRRITAYRCTFSDGVIVDHYVGQKRLGGLQADELVLLFDIGGQDRGLARRDQASATAPTSQPDDSPPKRLVVQWNGRLALGPVQEPPDPGQSRRQFEARGHPVTVELPNGMVRCGRLILHEETKRLWLYPAANGLVELSSAGKLSVQAAGVFVDLEGNIVKLIGQVLFRSGTRVGQAAQPLTIRCNLWAELHLAAGGDRNLVENVFDNPLASRPPESAVFIGDVEVKYEDQRLRAHRLDARFRRIGEYAEAGTLLESAGDGERSESAARVPAMEALLESAVATGDVRLTVVDRSGRRGWRRVFERRAAVLERALVRSLSKRGREYGYRSARPEDRALECASLQLDFALTEGQARIRRMEGIGAVEIYDRDSRFAARGRRIAATFAGGEELERATVSGTEVAPALVRARAYALRGKEINVDNQARTLRVDGRSRLAFRSRRSLQGLTRRRAETITVISNDSMRVDERQNTVHFIGQVIASTGDEQLLADALTLLLVDADAPRTRTAWSAAEDALRMMRGKLFGRSDAARTPRPLLAATRSRSGDRKDLAGVLARNAEIRSVIYAPGDPEPLVYQSVAGPELEIDVRRRTVRTVGETALLMTDRRLRDDAGRAGAELGFPSALMSRGPSQTAMSCARGLTYVLGEEGPHRKDSVLLEGGVRFRHVTGRKMHGFEQLLPEAAADPAILERHEIRNRNISMDCHRLEGVFAAADESEGARRAALDLRPSLQVSLLNAHGNVYVCDQQDAVVREVYAHQLEFNRPQGVIRVLGSPGGLTNAKVYEENRETGRTTGPVVFPEIIIDLKTNTIHGRDIRGRAGG